MRNFSEWKSSLNGTRFKIKIGHVEERRREKGFAEIRSSRQTWKVYIIKISGLIFSHAKKILSFSLFSVPPSSPDENEKLHKNRR